MRLRLNKWLPELGNWEWIDWLYLVILLAGSGGMLYAGNYFATAWIVAWFAMARRSRHYEWQRDQFSKRYRDSLDSYRGPARW